MQLRRVSRKNRKYSAGNAAANTVEVLAEPSYSIPLPNEPDIRGEDVPDTRKKTGTPLNIFGMKLFLDDIILVGLLLLLFEEGVEDGILVLLLIYIFISDKI